MMKSSEPQSFSLILGLDVGDRRSEACIMQGGAVAEFSSVKTEEPSLRKLFARPEHAHVVLETGTHSLWIADLAEQCGHKVTLVDARRFALLRTNQRKTDKKDSELLAKAANSEFIDLWSVRRRSPQTRSDVTKLRLRDGLVASRSALINQVRGCAKSLMARLPPCDANYFARKAAELLPKEHRRMFAPMLKSIAEITANIRAYDKELAKVAELRYSKPVERMRQVPGVGPLTSLAMALAIEDPTRFKKSRDVAAYFGLVPGKHESGEMDVQKRITKSGDGMTRRYLVQAAHYVLGPHGPDCDLKRFGQALAATGGPRGKRRAVVAVARRLAVLLHRLWVSGQTYDPDHKQTQTQTQSLKRGRTRAKTTAALPLGGNSCVQKKLLKVAKS